MATLALGMFGLADVETPATAAADADPVVTGLSPETGPAAGGISITISGTGLGRAGEATSVSFGLVRSPLVKVESAERIVAFSPPQPAGTVAALRVQVGTQVSVQGPPFTYVEGGWLPTADLASPGTTAGTGSASALSGHSATLLHSPACDGASPPPAYPCGKVLVAGGHSVSTDPEQLYDPVANQGEGAWEPTEALGNRSGHEATLLGDGRVLVTGGSSLGVIGGIVHASASVFDPTADGKVDGVAVRGGWLATGSMASPRAKHTATLLDPPDCHSASPPTGYPCGKVLVVGGGDKNGDPLATTELFDPGGGAGNRWAPAAPLPQPRTRHTATLLPDGRVLVAGGQGGQGDTLASAALYDPVGGGWAPAPSMSTPRLDHYAVLLDPPACQAPSPPACGQVLVASSGSAELYDPAGDGGSGAWAPTGGNGVLSDAGFAADALPDGRVLAVSKHVGYSGTAPAALFDPANGTWTAAAALPAQQAEITLTVLDDGRALAANVTLPGETPVARPVGRKSFVFDPSFTPTPVVESIEPATGPPDGGTMVTVRGRNLFGAPAPGQPGTSTVVRFDDTPAVAVDFRSDAELVATSPPHPTGLAVVTVVTPTGSSPTVATALFTYVGEGRWGPTGSLDACDPGSASPPRACAPRSDHQAVLLDPPACRDGTADSAYPCGTVLAVGRSRTTFGDGQVANGSTTLRSTSARFTDDDLGLAAYLPSDNPYLPPGTTVKRVIDDGTVELSAPVVGAAVEPVSFTLSGNSAERYDPASGEWRPTGAMVTRGTEFPSNWELGRFEATLLPDGTVLVAGGCCGAHRTTPGEDPSADALATAELYDPITSTWSPTGMPLARMGHTATLLDRPDCHGASPPADYPCGKVLVAGGRPYANGMATGQTVQVAQLYDPARRSWSEAGNMVTGRYGHTATLLPSGDVLVVGGAGDRDLPLSSAELYRPTLNKWIPAAGLAEATILHSATLLERPDCRGASPPADYPCGKVLVAGAARDFDPDTNLAGAGKALVQLYDPAEDTWSSSSVPGAGAPAPLLVPRAGHSATLLADGEVLVAGGFVERAATPSESMTAAAEVYEPATGRWRPVRPMAAVRATHSATVLDRPDCRGTDPPTAYRCGQVLVAGGRQGNWGQPYRRLGSAELYTPAPAVAGVSPPSGPSAGSTTVTIIGTNLADHPEVRFGGVAAEVVGVSPTIITATAPEHVAGPVEVEVRTPAGTSAVRAGEAARTYAYVVSRAPGPVGQLEAEAVSAGAVRLRFSAAASDAHLPPPARRYVVKVDSRPIVDEAGFAAADALCGGTCELSPPAPGSALTVNVGGLEAATTYHFAVRAVNDVGAGPLSNPASATTPDDRPVVPPVIPPVVPPSACVAPGPPGPGQVAYPAGYSLVGLPEGTVVGGVSTLYSWFDQGAGGTYSSLAPGLALAGGRGSWAWSPCPRLVRLAGSGPAVASLPLGAYRASMVGNPTDRPVTVSGFDWAARWDPSLNAGTGGYHLSGYRQAQSLAVGQGIWVFSFKPTTITFR